MLSNKTILHIMQFVIISIAQVFSPVSGDVLFCETVREMNKPTAIFTKKASVGKSIRYERM